MEFIEYPPSNQSEKDTFSANKDKYSNDPLHYCCFEGKWYVIFSSDKTHTKDTDKKNLCVYLFDLKTGNKIGDKLANNSDLRDNILRIRAAKLKQVRKAINITGMQMKVNK